MMFVPRHGQVVGRTLVKSYRSKIIRPDETMVSKFILIDAVGPDAAKAGLKPGDVVLPRQVMSLSFEGVFRPATDETAVLFTMKFDSLENEFLVQTEDGSRFVSFSSDEAAKPLGESPPEKEKEEAA